MTLSIPEFILTLKQNLDYYSHFITPKIFVLTTAMGDIIVTPSISEFCHLHGGNSFPRCKSIKALEFVDAVKYLHHEREDTYDILGISKVIDEMSKKKQSFPTMMSYFKTLYFQKAFESFINPKKKKQFYVFHKNDQIEDFSTDYLYLYNGDADFPIYLGILGKKEEPHFIFNSLYIDLTGKWEKRGLAPIKVTNIQILDNTSENLTKLMEGKVVISRHYIKEKNKAKKPQNSEKKNKCLLEPRWSITSDRFLKELTREVRAIDRKFSVKYGSSTKSSFHLLYDSKRTPINLKIPDDLKTPTQVAKYLTDQYYKHKKGDNKKNSRSQKNRENKSNSNKNCSNKKR